MKKYFIIFIVSFFSIVTGNAQQLIQGIALTRLGNVGLNPTDPVTEFTYQLQLLNPQPLQVFFNLDIFYYEPPNPVNLYFGTFQLSQNQFPANIKIVRNSVGTVCNPNEIIYPVNLFTNSIRQSNLCSSRTRYYLLYMNQPTNNEIGNCEEINLDFNFNRMEEFNYQFYYRKTNGL